MVAETIEETVERYASPQAGRDERDYGKLAGWLAGKFGLPATPQDVEVMDEGGELSENIVERVRAEYDRREQQVGSEQIRALERYLLLQVIDTRWKDHLHAMDQLRGAIGLRAYGQKDPKVAYKFEAYEMFQAMIHEIREQVTDLIMKVQLVDDHSDRARSVCEGSELTKNDFNTFDEQREAAVAGSQSGERPKPFVRGKAKVGRNDPCPCGSGKKYKKCCGAS